MRTPSSRQSAALCPKKAEGNAAAAEERREIAAHLDYLQKSAMLSRVWWKARPAIDAFDLVNHSAEPVEVYRANAMMKLQAKTL